MTMFAKYDENGLVAAGSNLLAVAGCKREEAEDRVSYTISELKAVRRMLERQGKVLSAEVITDAIKLLRSL